MIHWKIIQGPALEREYRFHPDRKFQADFAHVESRVLIEIEGGIFKGGRHTSLLGFARDCEKYNEANRLGWRLFRLMNRPSKGWKRTTGPWVDCYATLAKIKEAIGG